MITRTQPPYSKNYVPAHPYAHLIGRQAYPEQRGLFAWIGDRLNIGETVILRGVYPRRYLIYLLGRFGVRVIRVGYQAAADAPWWKPWRRDTYIHVARYHGQAARAILEDSKFEVMD